MLRISTQGRFEADTNAMILQLVSNGLGWSIVPALAILHEKGFYKNITAHKINSPVATRLTYIIYTELFYENLANFIAVLIKKFMPGNIKTAYLGYDDIDRYIEEMEVVDNGLDNQG